MKSRGRVVPLAFLLFLAVAVTPAASAPRHLRSVTTKTPDWLVFDRAGDEDGSRPLSFFQLAKAIRETVGGLRLYGLRVTSGGVPFAGDRRLLTTVTPNGDGVRDTASVRFRLRQAASVQLTVYACSKHPKAIWRTRADLSPGKRHLDWAPSASTLPRTYLLRLTVTANGKRHVYGSTDYRLAELQPAPVVRVLGIEAGFTRRSYSPGAVARLRVAADVPTFVLQIFQASPENEATTGYAMRGVPVGGPKGVDWSTHERRAGSLFVRIGDWPNGIYFAQLTGPDGKTYDAPFIVRPHPYGLDRVAVVLHTNTWHAYNHQDSDGNGWGDTWYATSEDRTVNLARPYIKGGAPPKWRLYDLPFLHWLYRTGKTVDFISDDDLESFTSARALTRLYDLIVFPGHEEYVTSHTHDLVTGYRNRGGNLMFLSATNFLWRIDRHGDRITRRGRWRRLGRPESRLIGVQYRGNDEGAHHGRYVVSPYGRSSWAFAGIDERELSAWRWFGIEYDMPTSVSPPGTRVLARVNPHMRDRGVRGVMTYYERGGAKVFAAGTLNFAGGLIFPPYRRLLENVWDRLAQP